VDFQNLHSLGGCAEGDVVSGGIEYAPDSLTADIGGAEVETSWGGLGGGYDPDG
jgi:hypothetical protein